jgi:transcriptional activator of cad operon
LSEKSHTTIDVISLAQWRATRTTGELIGPVGTERLEPKVMDLLFLLASRPGQAFSKDEIMQRLWPNVVVGDDTLARAVSRLRKALGDNPKTPSFIETLPKRGYRLVVPITAESATGPGQTPPPARPSRRASPSAWIGGALACAVAVSLAAGSVVQYPSGTGGARSNELVERANDFYFQYTRADNEAAIELFNRILTDSPDHPPALAGLANALVQKVVRWPDEPGAAEMTKLGDAIAAGRTKTDSAKQLLARARIYAERALHLAPNDPAALKALGFVQSAQGDFGAAITTYKAAIAIDKDAWGPMINIGDVLEISGRSRDAVPYFEAAYAAMARVYDSQSARVRPWHGALGVVIGDRYKTYGNHAAAEIWYRTVLAEAPLHVEATGRLAALLREIGDASAAESLCANLRARTGAAICG